MNHDVRTSVDEFFGCFVSSFDELQSSEFICLFAKFYINWTDCSFDESWHCCVDVLYLINHRVLSLSDESQNSDCLHVWLVWLLTHHMRPFNINIRPNKDGVRLQGFGWLGLRSLSLTSLHSEPCKAIPTGPGHETESLLGTALLALSLLSLTHFL